MTVDAESDDPDFSLRLSRASQTVRSHQSHRALPVVIVTGLAFSIALWNDAPRHSLVFWVVMIVVSAVVRILVCRRIASGIEEAGAEKLALNEKWFLMTALCNTILVGSGFWLERAVIAVTLLSCMYGIGTTVNTSIYFPTFPVILAGNMAQGVLFHSGIGGAPEIATLVAYLSIVLVLLTFGKESATMFAESIKMRVENLYLVHQLGEEKQEVEKALQLAEEANESKNRFLAAASHDLRQPLHALSLFHGGLKMELSGERAEHLMDRIDETTSVLRDQFNSLLDLSRFDAGGVDPDPKMFRVDRLLNRIVETNRPMADTRNIELILDAEVATVYTDELLFERVIQNLVSNAIRYTEIGSVRIHGSTEALPEKDKTNQIFVVRVEDTGLGIAKEDQTRIFEDFAQLVNPERRREQGVGLGLAIVRRIDQLLGLGLSMRSTPGAGTCFTVSLPCLQSELGTVEDTAPPVLDNSRTSTFQGFLVWTVDDDERVREAMMAQLMAWKCDVVAFETIADTKRTAVAENRLPDLLLVDDMLDGGANGLEIADWFSDRLDEDRIVLVTGNTDRQRLAQLRSTAYRVLQKPLRSSELERIIQRLVQNRDSGGRYRSLPE